MATALVTRPLCPYCEEEDDSCQVCGMEYDGWTCTRTVGHKGDHVACAKGADYHELARWLQLQLH